MTIQFGCCSLTVFSYLVIRALRIYEVFDLFNLYGKPRSQTHSSLLLKDIGLRIKSRKRRKKFQNMKYADKS